MVRNFIKVAWRNLLTNKIYSLINIIGLSIGLASFIVLLLYLNYELSYDKWDPSLKRVFKISQRTDEDILTTTAAPLGNFLKQNIAEIETSTTIQPGGDFEALLSTEGKKIYQTGSLEADSSFLKVFPYKIINGNTATALDKPNAIIISRELSQKLFGNSDPVGKRIKIYNAFENEVTAVFDKPAGPSNLDVQFIYRSPYRKQSMFWENLSFQTYVKTKAIISVQKLEDIANRVFYTQQIKKSNQSLEDFRKKHQEGLFVDGLQQLHNFPQHGNSNFPTIAVLLILACLLLVAGAINFSNLSIAVSIRRAKEVGVRKVLGCSQRQLFWQFMSEIAFQCMISLCVAVILVSLALPYFNTEFAIHISFLQSGMVGSICMQVAGCLLLVILLSGLYPSVFLAYFNTAKVLKGDYSRGKTGAGFRNALITAQFAVSAFFIMGVIIISSQMHYMQSKDKGFSGNQVIRIESTQQTREGNFDQVKNKLLAIPGLEYVAKTTTVPGDKLSDTTTIPFKYQGAAYRMSSVKVSDDYFKTLSIELINGRLFNNSYNDEHTRNAIINESAAKKINATHALGGTLTFPMCDSIPVQVIGIVKDFSTLGFENSIKPVVYTIGNNACRFQSGGAILAKIKGSHVQQTIASIQHLWKNTEPDFPIRYAFIDDNFQKLFQDYIRLQKILNFFATAAIMIAVMGLFALTALLTGQRTKEIGIRKVLGACYGDMVILLNKNFIRLVVLAALLALPLAWWAGNTWLEGFAYRIRISWWFFVLAALIVIIISIVTVSIQTLKVSMSNPVKSLRTE